MDNHVALLSVRRLILLGSEGKQILLIRLKQIANVEVKEFEDGEWRILILLTTSQRYGSSSEVIRCNNRAQALELYQQIKNGMDQVEE